MQTYMKKNYTGEHYREEVKSTRFSPKLRRQLAIVSALIVLAVIVVVNIIRHSNGVQAVDKDQAKVISLDYVPESASFLSGEENENQYSFQYFDSENFTKYEVTLDKSGDMLSLEQSVLTHEGSKEVLVTKEDVQKQFKKDFPDADLENVALLEDDGLYDYEVRYQDGSHIGVALYSVDTANLVKNKIRKGNHVLLSIDDNDKAYDELMKNNKYMSMDEIKELALKQVPEAEIKNIDFSDGDDDKEEARYEVTLLREGVEYDLLLSAEQGDVLGLRYNKPDEVLIKEAEANKEKSEETRRNILLDARGNNDDDEEDDDIHDNKHHGQVIIIRNSGGSSSTSILNGEKATEGESTQKVKTTTRTTTKATTQAPVQTTRATTKAPTPTTRATTKAPVYITASQAIQIAARNAGISASYFDAVWDDDGYWDVEAEVGDYEYEYKISRTGSIISKEIDD